MSEKVTVYPRSSLAEVVEFLMQNDLGGQETRTMHASVQSLANRLPLLLQDAPMEFDRISKSVSMALLSSRFQDTGMARINFSWGFIQLRHWNVWP